MKSPSLRLWLFLLVSLSPCLPVSPALAADWTRCADENGVCTFTGAKTVRYGANGVFVSKQATDSIACDNATFSDPLVGFVKFCEFTDAGVVLGGPIAGDGLPMDASPYATTQPPPLVVNGTWLLHIRLEAGQTLYCSEAIFGEYVIKKCWVDKSGQSLGPTR